VPTRMQAEVLYYYFHSSNNACTAELHTMYQAVLFVSSLSNVTFFAHTP
jgi:hypothetical protein